MQDEISDRRDKPAFFRDRNELGGRDKTALAMRPTEQRLETRNLAGIQRHERLIMNFQSAAHVSVVKLALDLAPRLHANVHFRLEIPVAPLAVTFSLIERQVGVLQKRFGGLAVARAQSDADARGDVDGLIIDREWLS